MDDNDAVSSDVHPEPTVATVKKLYAHALRCARPDCKRPLYNQDNDTGELSLNSRIAHIHARRRGGPRWIEMTSEQNRADSNLLLLCIEHSYEVDEREDTFPPDLLREWKRTQLDEYTAVQRGWPLTDIDAGRVLEASAASLEREHAGAVVAVMRASARLGLAAQQAHEGPAAAAAAWRAAREQARRSFHAWDEDGNPVYAEPSRSEAERHRAAVHAALGVVRTTLTPLANEVKVELAPVRASRPTTNPWIDWVARAVDLTITASSTWADPPEPDDERLEASLLELTRATDALAAAWRGDRPAQPPPVAVAPPAEAAIDDPLAGHRALLDRARPFHRVEHRPYDPDLRAQLAAAAEQASTLPPVMSALGFGLSTTCGLAAAVAANATQDELAALAEQDASRRPLSAAVVLLAEAQRFAHRRANTEWAALVEARLIELWHSVDLADVATYDEGDANGRSVFEHGTRVTTSDQVRERLEAALAFTPEILLPLVAYCADWYENVDIDDWRTRAIGRRYRELPTWFPTAAVIAAATARGAASITADGVTDTEGAKSLLAEVLRLARG